jgi:hypothetical protein
MSPSPALNYAVEYFYPQSFTGNVPTTPSEFVINVWSNGDSGFSQGPPTADSIASIKTLKFYFNSTSLTEAQFNQQCLAAGNVAQCVV